MRLVVKVLAVLLFVAVVPVAVSGASAVVLARRALGDGAARALDAEARHLAELAETTVLGSLDDLRQASLLGMHALSAAEQTGALWLIYRADAQRTAVALIDGDTGQSVVDPVFQPVVGAEPGLADHEALPRASLSTFAAHVPLAEALAAGQAIGVPYADPARGAPFIVLAVRVPGPVDGGRERPLVVAVELSLRRLNARFAEARDEGLRAFLVDLAGRVVCDTDAASALRRADLNAHPGVAALVDPSRPVSSAVNLEDTDASMLVAYARLTRLAGAQARTWGVVVEQPRAAALAELTALVRRVTFWVTTALVLAVAASLVLARGVARPVEILTGVVARYAGRASTGSDRVRAPALGTDEIGRLAAAFNAMADVIDDRDRQLRAFNDDLQKRVDERTRELKDTQTQLIQSQKMAAVGELGASVAHEINNPLAAVLGAAQLALLRSDRSDRVRPQLEDIEKEALRIREIVESLLRLSQEQSQQAMGTVDVNSVVDAALALVARSVIGARIAVKKELDPHLPKIRGRPADLQQAVLQVLQNARDAMPEGGTLTIRTDAVDGKLVRVHIDDTGAGVAPNNLERVFEPLFTTRGSKGHKGMGLALVHRIVEEHAGRVVVESAGVGKGAAVKFTFAATRDAPHLV